MSIYAQDAVHDARPNPIYTVSVDEKPGVQAIGLSASDLHTEHIFADVEDSHRSVEFIGLLRQIDAHYPGEAIIRLILDNHSTHVSKDQWLIW